MDCSKLSANIAAATCRTGRIDVRELMLVNWDDWQKYQREFVLEGETVPPLFNVTHHGEETEGTTTPSTLNPYTPTVGTKYLDYIGKAIEMQDGDKLYVTADLPTAKRIGSILVFPNEDVIQMASWTTQPPGWSAAYRENLGSYVAYIGASEPGIEVGYRIERKYPKAGNDLTLSLSDGITYPPVVSLLATHERGIVSFAEEVNGAYLNGYAHRIQFTAFDRKQSVKDVLNILVRGRFVALARYEQDGEDVVVVYGADCGMVAEAETFDSSNTDGEIGQAVLATDEGCMESVPMLTLEPSGSLATVAEAWEWLKEHAFG